MSEKDLEGAPLARVPLTDGELDSLEKLLSGTCPAPWYATRWDGTLGRSALRAPVAGPAELHASFSRRGYGNAGTEAGAIAALRNAAPSLISELQAARAWRKEAEALLGRCRAHVRDSAGCPDCRHHELEESLDAFLGEREGQP